VGLAASSADRQTDRLLLLHSICITTPCTELFAVFILCIITFVCAILVYLFVTDYALVIYRVIILFDSIQLPILVGSLVILT